MTEGSFSQWSLAVIAKIIQGNFWHAGSLKSEPLGPVSDHTPAQHSGGARILDTKSDLVHWAPHRQVWHSICPQLWCLLARMTLGMLLSPTYNSECLLGHALSSAQGYLKQDGGR